MKKYTELIILLVTVAFSGSVHTLADEAKSEHAPRITCEQPTYDFGEMDNTSKVDHTFMIKNEGDLTLVISRVKPACGCTVANLSTKEIPPGETATLSTTLSLKNRHGHQRKSIRVESNDPKTPNFMLYLEGQAVSEIEVSPRNAYFGQVAQTATGTKSVEITTKKPLQITMAVSSSEFFVPSLDKTGAPHKYILKIDLKPPIPMGATQGEIRLKREKGADVVIPVSVMGVGPLSVAPKELVIRSVNQQPVTRYIIVRPGETKDFQLLGVELPNEQMSSSITALGNNGYRIQLKNIESSETLDGKKVIIKTDVERMPTIEIPFKIIPAR